MAAELTYMIWDGILAGNAGGRGWFIMALSGGAGGATRRRPTADANNPYSTGVKTTGKTRGGPIPNGRYKISKPSVHSHLGLSARLTPVNPALMMGRGGFYIHGRGPRGSDGCIVPLENFAALMKALERDGGGMLRVVDTTADIAFA